MRRDFRCTYMNRVVFTTKVFVYFAATITEGNHDTLIFFRSKTQIKNRNMFHETMKRLYVHVRMVFVFLIGTTESEISAKLSNTENERQLAEDAQLLALNYKSRCLCSSRSRSRRRTTSRCCISTWVRLARTRQSAYRPWRDLYDSRSPCSHIVRLLNSKFFSLAPHNL
jgi:hypothetical protein